MRILKEQRTNEETHSGENRRGETKKCIRQRMKKRRIKEYSEEAEAWTRSDSAVRNADWKNRQILYLQSAEYRFKDQKRRPVRFSSGPNTSHCLVVPQTGFFLIFNLLAQTYDRVLAVR